MIPSDAGFSTGLAKRFLALSVDLDVCYYAPDEVLAHVCLGVGVPQGVAACVEDPRGSSVGGFNWRGVLAFLDDGARNGIVDELPAGIAPFRAGG